MTTINPTPAQKAGRTRAIKSAEKLYDLAVEPQYKEWEAALGRNYPIRDGNIERLKAKRDVAIKAITDQYDADYALEMEQFKYMMKKTQDALDSARAKAMVKYLEVIKAGA